MRSKPAPKPPTPLEPALGDAPPAAPKLTTHGKVSAGAPRLRRILAPIDFSDSSLRAWDYARLFAEQFGAQVTLLHVVEPAVSGYLPGALALDDSSQKLVEAARERLGSLIHKHGAHGLMVEILVRIGHSYSEIADTAKALGADLIVLGAQGAGGLKQALLGSTAERVVRQAACPVLTVPFSEPGTERAAPGPALAR